MYITTVKPADDQGNLGAVTDCFDAGNVAELILCGDEMTIVLTDGTQINVPGDEEPDAWQRCPRCHAKQGEEHTCQNPIRV